MSTTSAAEARCRRGPSARRAHWFLYQFPHVRNRAQTVCLADSPGADRHAFVSYRRVVTEGRDDGWTALRVRDCALIRGCTENSAVVHTNVCSPASPELGHSLYPFGISETCPVAPSLHPGRASP